MTTARKVSLVIMAVFFVIAGLNHFRDPASYLTIMPACLPAPLTLIYGSGIAEVAGAAGILIPGLRQLAGWGLIALLVAVFPANVQGAMHGMVVGGHAVPAWILWARLPLQFALIAWVWWTCLAKARLARPELD